MPRYDAQRIEAKWQRYWDDHKTFKTPDFAEGKRKLYVLDMFPYPSGDGLHVGHPEGYTATDIICRYSRMRGRHVLHPMGWDAFGLPAEQHAKKTGTHPAITTQRNIATFRRQLKMLGFSYDWSRELATTDPDYFRWTQWIFLEIFDTWYDRDCRWSGPDGKEHIGRGRPISELPIPDAVRKHGDEAVRRYQDRHRLAYQHEAPVNWCPALGTVLANEEVVDGRSERGGHPVERLPLRQWMLRITAYAERLLADLEEVDWPESIKLLQRNWIGRSEGAEVDFYIGEVGSRIEVPPINERNLDAFCGLEDKPLPIAEMDRERWMADHIHVNTSFYDWARERGKTGFPAEPGDDVLRIYTTRPDTLFGATYMVLAPEHPSVDRLTTPQQREAVVKYRGKAAGKSDLDRTDLAKEKTGVFTGSYAVNPVNGERIPIWIADYVLISYGTGAIMAVPAHDERDFEFAERFGLPIRRVVDPPQEWKRSSKFMRFADQYLGNPSYFSAMHLLLDHRDDTLERIQQDIDSEPELAPTLEVHKPDDDCGIYVLERKGAPRELWFGLSGTYHPVYLHEAFTQDGVAVNSDHYDGLSTAEFKAKITADLSTAGLGRKAVNYRLRDWLFSRQHFWGEPFPIWHELDAKGRMTGLLRADPPEYLPITLPEDFEFKPHNRPEPPLEEAGEKWLYKTDADGTRLKRETNSMPQWAGSCWYYLRFIDPRNDERFVDPEKERYWMPVDLYVGGAEHAVLHLLYARFWHKVLFDRGHVSTVEPFQRLVNQGMILGEAELTGFRDGAGGWVSAKAVEVQHDQATGRTIRVDSASGEPVEAVRLQPDQVERKGDEFVLIGKPDVAVDSRAYKMSKSRGNVISPDDIVAQYGADALRMYEMFMGPLDQVKPWSMSGVEGVSRFLSRVWRMVTDERADAVCLNPAVKDVAPNDEQLRILHRTIKAVTEDIEKMSFNTAISRLMEFTNAIGSHEPRPIAVLEPFVLLLSPLAPHIAEELWELLGHSGSLAYEPWPCYDESFIAESEIEIPVQVNGKLRGKVKVPADADQATIQQIAEQNEQVAAYFEGKQTVKVIVVPGRLVNFVVK